MRPIWNRSIGRNLLAIAPLAIGTAAMLAVVLVARAGGEEGDVQPTTYEVEVAVEQAAGSDATARAERDAVATPTHHQTGLVKATVADQSQTTLKCFCLTPDNRILAGCASGAGEIRVFDEQGSYLETWSLPVQPEAICVRADGATFLAGEGRLVRLSPTGRVELQQEAPHVAALNSDLDAVRREVIAQEKQRAEMYANQTRVYDQLIERIDKQIADLKQQIDAADGAEEAAVADNEADARRHPASQRVLQRQLAMQERMKAQYEQIRDQFDERAAQNQPVELTEEQIAERVKATIRYKQQASSISATADEVFVATRATAGYGFDVWKMDDQFAGGERIVTGLSGCCGQMDVKVNDDGVFVAENSKHRVCRYDRDGKLVCNWGHGAREGLDGFGSCCNPMNVAFGPDGAVYTAEDNTGRIKRYSPDGELLGLVGSVDLVPGCKNCSIAVNADGSRVYMLDITRGHIVRMEPYAPGEAPGPVPYEDEQAGQLGAVNQDASGSTSPDVGGAMAKGVLRFLGFGD